ncbi:ABC transporter permease [Streptomyces sp. 769]|uniref:ABC transporter permease n=1 Tax=Streptomyces sp. 769 TaxID=1262452 RepID=UPI000581D543|nr:ABC transporter permease [Streptomyces sp. 769]AJC53640.1 ABC-2 type transporter [Streptomyces sp. 769]
MIAFYALSRAMLKEFLRDWFTLLFTFFFPLLFVVYGIHQITVSPDRHDLLERVIPLYTWSVAGTGVFGMGMSLVDWRRRHLLRRIRQTPASTLSVLFSRITVILVITAAQTAAFFTVLALPPFSVRLGGSWWLCLPAIALGALSFACLGLLIGARCNNDQAGVALANLLITPMALVCGTFFDLRQAPGWIQSTAHLLPLYHVNQAMGAVLADNSGLTALYSPVASLIAFSACTALVALVLFRWEQDTP